MQVIKTVVYIKTLQCSYSAVFKAMISYNSKENAKNKLYLSCSITLAAVDALFMNIDMFNILNEI